MHAGSSLLLIANSIYFSCLKDPQINTKCMRPVIYIIDCISITSYLNLMMRGAKLVSFN